METKTKQHNKDFNKILYLAKAQILEDVSRGTVPETVSSFSELHDYVDANYYGGFIEENYNPSKDYEFENSIQTALDQWIKAGGIKTDFNELTMFKNGGETNSTEKGASGRYHILGETKGTQPVLYASTNDKTAIAAIVKQAEKDLEALTRKKYNVLVTDSLEDREIYNYANGGELPSYMISKDKLIDAWRNKKTLEYNGEQYHVGKLAGAYNHFLFFKDGKQIEVLEDKETGGWIPMIYAKGGQLPQTDIEILQKGLENPLLPQNIKTKIEAKIKELQAEITKKQEETKKAAEKPTIKDLEDRLKIVKKMATKKPELKARVKILEKMIAKEKKNKPSAKEIEKFIDYVTVFYGKDYVDPETGEASIFGKDYNGGFTKSQIKEAVTKYVNDPKTVWGGGDSVDRELMRDRYLAPLVGKTDSETQEAIDYFEKHGFIEELNSDPKFYIEALIQFAKDGKMNKNVKDGIQYLDEMGFVEDMTTDKKHYAEILIAKAKTATPKMENGGSIGFIPMDLEEDLMITAKWGGTNINGVIGFLNAMVDSNLTDDDLKIKPTKNTRFQIERAEEKKIQEIWNKIEPNYKGGLKGNMYYSTIKRLVQRANSGDEILKRFKPFRKYQKFENGAEVERIDHVNSFRNALVSYVKERYNEDVDLDSTLISYIENTNNKQVERAEVTTLQGNEYTVYPANLVDSFKNGGSTYGRGGAGKVGVTVQKDKNSPYEFVADGITRTEAQKFIEEYKQSGKPYHDIMIDDLPFEDGGGVPEELKGYRVEIYTSSDGNQPFNVVSNGQFKNMVLVTDGKTGDSSVVMSNEPYLRLENKNVFGKIHTSVVPVNIADKKWKMFGGNFVWSSDSRFREEVSERPLPLHDRVEYEDGGEINTYNIFEGYDHYNQKPLYQVVGKNNDYVGEWHDDIKDAEEELEDLQPKIKNGEEVEVYDTLAFKTKKIAEKNEQEIRDYFKDRLISSKISTGKDERGNYGFQVIYTLNKEYKKGGETWIQDAVEKMEKKGTVGSFTNKAARHGLTPIEYAKKVLANPDKHTEKTRRQAQFVKNTNPELFEDGGEVKSIRFTSNDYNKLVGDVSEDYPYYSVKNGSKQEIFEEKTEQKVATWYMQEEELKINQKASQQLKDDLINWLKRNSYITN